MKEPQFSIEILLYLHNWMNKNELLLYRIPIFADIRVFSYPLLLTSLYLRGIHKNNDKPKKLALYLFSSTAGVFITNHIIKLLINKPRPYIELGLDTPKEELLLNQIPTDTFPSDHAAVSSTIAIGLLRRGIKNKKTFYQRLSLPFWIFAFSMGIGRITIGIHRPTDIIAGFAIGIIVSIGIYQNKRLEKLYHQIINIEKTVISFLKRNSKC